LNSFFSFSVGRLRIDVRLTDEEDKLFSNKMRLICLQLPCFTKEADDCENHFCCMVLTLISYAYDFEVDGIKYSILSRERLTVSVSGVNDTCSGDIVIPSTVTYGAYTFSKSALPLWRGVFGFRFQVSGFRFLVPFNFQLLLFRYRAV